MKQLLIIVLALITSSCCNAKKMALNSSEKIYQNNFVTVDKISETTKDSITQTIEVKDKKNNVIAEVDTYKEANQVIANNSKKTDTIAYLTLPPKPPKQDSLATFSHGRWNTLLEKHVSDQGNVNYLQFKSDKTILAVYIDALSENVPTDSWSKQEKLAYWINTYNALTVDLILRNYPIKSIKDIKDPWKQRLWKLGNKWYNLDEIEHQILRKMDEPRIHFAIVCASYSCPKLQNKAFTAEHLETQLTNATKEFLSDTKRNEISENSLKLSKIFRWFDNDFKQNGSLIDFINTYTTTNISEDAKISYKDYNWDLND
ncbi:DUF547 domain-containing protein [Olleya aquimaris]|uniref:Uncharacterized protein DUF547 n=1 Tax=Olleya aquimaris TaxID=639310 RepID=A0A327RGL3_9FLAO|nr:DUF547 domain-containing protein [Olleya aquimaris]RAJ15102.1 uncharacterized protein DUF547 [Olleya aquimaris]